MKVGYQTKIWGERIPQLECALDAIAAAGYHGVEIGQRPELLSAGGKRLSFDDLIRLLDQRNLDLIGLSHGTLQERIIFCDGTKQPYYFCVETWRDEWEPLLDHRGLVLALHPHVYKTVNSLAQANKMLELHPSLHWLADTGHLYVAGDDVVRALEVFPERLVAVHLKDWTPAFGTSPHRYSRGFTELGRGVVPLDAVILSLKRRKYQGWLVVEQDSSRNDVFSSLLDSAEWLHERGLIHKLPQRLPAGVQPIASAQIGSDLRLRVASSLATVEDTNRQYEMLGHALGEVVGAKLVSVWACSPAHGLLSLIASDPPMLRKTQALETASSLSGIAVERRTITWFDLSTSPSGDCYGFPEGKFHEPDLQTELKLKWMVAIPVLNTHNRGHVRLVVNMFLEERQPSLTDDQLSAFAEEVGRAADAILQESCLEAAASTSFLAGKRKSPKEFATDFCFLIQRIIRCDGVTLFWSDESGERLTVAGTTGIEWTVDAENQYYRRGEGLTGAAWALAKPKLSAKVLLEEGGIGKSSETTLENLHSCLWQPFVNSNRQAVGLVRCQNKRIEKLGGFNMFSDDDVAIIEAAAQVSIPHLELMLADERRRDATARMTHELLHPATVIHTAIHMMQNEFRANHIDPTTYFKVNYLGDIEMWSALMIALIAKAEHHGAFNRDPQLDPTRTYLMAQVIAPAVRQVDVLLREKGYSPQSIEYDRLDSVPALWVDQQRFQQVMFNLLSNAIKYAFKDKSFQVQIGGERRGDEYRIFFRDWGEGIPQGFEQAIFREGFRAPRRGGRPITGQGYGLWIVDRVVRSHGGRCLVTRRHMPTEISLYLPAYLEHRPPNPELKEYN